MTGYEPPRALHNLDFSETRHAGLEVKMGDPSIDQLLAMQELAEQASGSAERSREMFRQFASFLVSWNVTQGGEPVPATYEGVVTQDPAFIGQIITAWHNGVTAAPPPLPVGSTPGGLPPEASLPTEAMSPSPSS
jgi:hypothetical protein